MLVSVEARTDQGALLTLPLENTFNGYVVEEIDGLDPVKANFASSSFAQLDGEHYQDSRREARDIKLTLGLEPDYVNTNVQMLRSRLYGHFMPKAQVFLRFIMDDGLSVDISGRVESFESKLFSREPKVDISVRCFKPDFLETTPIEASGMTTATTNEVHIDYQGTVETGLKFHLELNRSLTDFVVFHRPPGTLTRRFEFYCPMQNDDRLEINTNPGEKSINLIRESAAIPVLYGMAPHSQWMTLFPGHNYFRVQATGVPIPYKIIYSNKYGGL